MTVNPIKGGFGDDNLTGTSGNDIFNLTRGGNDTVEAGGGNDIFWMGATLNAGDKLDGGDGIDQVNLNGDYSAGLIFAADTIANIEKLYLAAGHDYNLTLNDGNVAAGARLMVNAQALGAGNSLTFDGSAELDGHFNIFAGAGNDTIAGGGANDMIHLDKGGEDTVHAGGGNDTIFLGDTLDPADAIDGGSGRDTVILGGLGDDQITFTATTMTNVEVLQLDPGAFSYEIITDDATVAAGATMTVDGSALSGSHAFHFDGSAETDGAFHFLAGTSLQTTLTGGQGNDFFDLTQIDSTALTQLDGQGGNDVFQFLANFDSSSQTIDGGTGANTLSLNGDYSFFSLVGGIIDNIQTVTLGGGHSYTGVHVFDDVSGGGALTIDATGLLAGDALALDASASTDALIVRAGDGTYTLTGSAQNDTFFMGAHFKAADSIDGGGGNHDILVLDGDYTGANTLVMAAATVTDVHSLLLLNHSYDITTADATVASGALMNINASNLASGQTLSFDGSAETDGSFQIVGGAGNDVLTGGQFGDLYDLSHGGNDTVHAGNGINEFDMGAALTAADSIHGGTGPDGMFLDGDYTGAHAVTFGATTMTEIDYLAVAAGHSYDLTANDATLDDAGLMSVDGSALGASDSLHFDGSAETAGSYQLIDGLGNDVLIGGGGTDLLSFNGGGTDIGKGGGGDDFVDACGHLDSADQFDGGTGTDSIELTASETSTGNYTGANALHLTATMMANFEQMDLDGGGSYDITTVDANVAAGVSFGVDASFLGTHESLTFDGSAETNGSFYFLDGAGDDALTGGALADTFDISGGGNDTVHGNGGGDLILATGPGALTAADTIDGGAGIDTLELGGDYAGAHALTLGAATLTNVEQITLDGGDSYDLTTNDANVANLQLLTVDASSLFATDSLTFNGAAETDGSFSITDGAGNDVLTGGAQGDQFLLRNGGTDTVHGGGGDDSIFAFGTLTAADTIDGGTGSNQLHLFGDYTGAHALVMGATTVTNVSSISFALGFSYDIATNDATVAAGQTLQVNAQTNSGDSVTFDGSAETDGHFSMLGGPGTDIFTGGALSDSFDMSNGGVDTVHGGGGNDTFNMGAAFTSADQIDGGTGANVLALTGAYSGLNFNAADAGNIQTIQFLGGFVESGITLTGDIAGGAAFLIINGFGAASLDFDGSGETGTTQFTIDGSAGDDVLTGGANNDGFNLTAGGNDTAHGGAGNDTFSFGANFTASDTVDGGANTDTISLAGDYSFGLTLGATTMTSVEDLVLNPGHDYNITFNDGNIAGGDALTVNVAALSGHTFTLNDSAETDGNFIVTAGAAFSASDSFIAGGGSSLLILNGDYSAGLTFGATTIEHVKEIELGGGFSYNLTTNDANVDSGSALTVDASALSGGDVLTFHGGAETNGTFTFDVDSTQVLASSQISGGAGDDALVLDGDFSGGVSFGSNTIHSVETITLTAGHSYSLDLSGNSVASGGTIAIDGSSLGAGNSFDFGFDTAGGGDASYDLTGGAGDDAFFMLDTLKASDRIDGGGGSNDEIQLNGDYSAGVTFNANTIKNIEALFVLNGNSYSFTENDGNVAAGATMGVSGSILGAANFLHFDGSAETDGHFQLIGGAGSDVLIGGAQSDILTGNGGADTLTGGGGADTFTYMSAGESTSTTYDTITDFASGSDSFDLPVSVSQVYAASGSLDSGANFDGELAGLDIVHVHGATVLTVTGGTLNGHVFLVVDGDGNATYDAGSDYVFDITGHTGTIATGDFI
ncbi:MAG TPA: calcium-binding protein [Rhizomicrobium sp.]|nr:calcium-binding protein [Rhizomicrobium sp.]